MDEFQEGEEVRILKDNERGGQLRIVENEKSAVFGPWILIGAGILIISMPFVQKQYGDAYVSAILAALMFLTGAALCASGTSFAVPFVTGSAALLMEWGIIRGNDPYLYGEKVKAYLRRGARHLPGYEQWPNNQLG